MGGWRIKRTNAKHRQKVSQEQTAERPNAALREQLHEQEETHTLPTDPTANEKQNALQGSGHTEPQSNMQNNIVPEQCTTSRSTSRPPQFICINCGNSMHQLYKRYSNCNAVKTVTCDECKKIADKYIEFEAVIVMVDAVLLSQQAFRHMLYNRNFKLHWKLSLILLLLESFALWRKKRVAFTEAEQYELVHEKGFYICCLHNIIDNIIIIGLLLSVALLQRDGTLLHTGLGAYTLTLLKAITLANFSKFFLLPIMVWRDNTTATAARIHHVLVLAHHLCALIFVYAVIGRGRRKLHAALVVLPVYLVKELCTRYISTLIESNF